MKVTRKIILLGILILAIVLLCSKYLRYNVISKNTNGNLKQHKQVTQKIDKIEQINKSETDDNDYKNESTDSGVSNQKVNFDKNNGDNNITKEKNTNISSSENSVYTSNNQNNTATTDNQNKDNITTTDNQNNLNVNKNNENELKKEEVNSNTTEKTDNKDNTNTQEQEDNIILNMQPYEIDYYRENGIIKTFSFDECKTFSITYGFIDTKNIIGTSCVSNSSGQYILEIRYKK